MWLVCPSLPALHIHVVDSTHYYWDAPTYPTHVSTRTWPKRSVLRSAYPRRGGGGF
jgi:hypothetical protein